MKRIVVLPLVILLTQVIGSSANLQPLTAQAWEEYVASASKGMEPRLRPGRAFLWVEEEPERLAKVRSGEIAVSPVGPESPKKVPLLSGRLFPPEPSAQLPRPRHLCPSCTGW